MLFNIMKTVCTVPDRKIAVPIFRCDVYVKSKEKHTDIGVKKLSPVTRYRIVFHILIKKVKVTMSLIKSFIVSNERTPKTVT